MKYGWKRDAPDGRDHKLMVARDGLVLPTAHDLTAAFPPPMDQGQWGTCTAHGVTAALRYNLINTDRPDAQLSRAQLYWESGIIEGDTGDNGRQIRDVIKAAAAGVAAEGDWDYFRVGHAPPRLEAVCRATEYMRVGSDRQAINTAIFVGHPVVIGVTVFKSFESEEVAATGRVPMPKHGESEVGGHCMLLGGYDEQYDLVLNSWGPAWGSGGYCYLPRGYVEKYGSDLWTIYSD